MTLTISCDTEPKQKNRELWADFISKHFSNKRRSNAKVLCLPGHEGLEIPTWDNLGFKRKNIYGVTNQQEDFEKIKDIRGIKPFLFNVFDMKTFVNLLTTTFAKFVLNDRPGFRGYKNGLKQAYDFNRNYFFDVIYLDLYSNFQADPFNNMFILFNHFLKNDGIAGVTFLCRREQDKTFKDLVNNKSINEREKAVAFLLTQILALGFASDLELDKVKSDISGNLSYSHKAGYYPIDFLLTHYIANSNPMGTVFGKFRRLSLLSKAEAKTKIANCLKSAFGREVVYINKPKTNKSRNKTQKVTVKRKKIVDSKKAEIIKWYKIGLDSKDIVAYYNIPMAQARAIKAHITMGTY